MWLLLFQTLHSFQHPMEAKCCSSLDHCPEGNERSRSGPYSSERTLCVLVFHRGPEDLGGRSGRGLNALTISYNLLQRLKVQPGDFRARRQGDSPTQALHPTGKVPGTEEQALCLQNQQMPP